MSEAGLCGVHRQVRELDVRLALELKLHLLVPERKRDDWQCTCTAIDRPCTNDGKRLDFNLAVGPMPFWLETCV